MSMTEDMFDELREQNAALVEIIDLWVAKGQEYEAQLSTLREKLAVIEEHISDICGNGDGGGFVVFCDEPGPRRVVVPTFDDAIRLLGSN